MDFINRAYGQLVDLFRSLSPAARLTTGLLAAVVVISLVYLFRFQTDRTEEYLFGADPLSRSEIVAIEAAFGQAGLSDFEVVGNKVRVPRARKNVYLKAAADAYALPQSFSSPWQRMFDSDSPFDNRDIRTRKARFAQESQLSFTIRNMRNVEEAQVTINEDVGSPFGDKKIRQALVAVKLLGNRTLDAEQVSTIRYTVAAGAFVKPEDVTVTDMNGQVYPGGGDKNGPSAFQNLYANYQREFVQDYQRKIEHRLSMYPGVKVAVNVELDRDLSNEVSSFKYDEKPTQVQNSSQTKESTSTTAEPGGRAGVATTAAPNQGGQVAATPTSENRVNESREDNKSVVGATQTRSEKAPLIPTWVAASIGVPKSLFLKAWQRAHPPAAGEEPKTPPANELQQIEADMLKEIEEAVVALLPPSPKGDDKYKPVKVVTFDDPAPVEIEAPSLAETAGLWFADNWQTLAMFGLAAFGLVFLRGMVRSAQAAAQAAEERASERLQQLAPTPAAATAAGGHDEDSAVETANSLKKKFQGGGRGLKEELAELVREDPDAAANVLKLWISDAA